MGKFLHGIIDLDEGEIIEVGEVVNESTTEKTVVETKPKPDVVSEKRYGITDVVKLIHTIPKKNMGSVLSTVVRTIESFGIGLDSIIDDALVKEARTCNRLHVLKQEIETYKQGLKSRENEVKLLEVGLTEIVKTREFLERGASIVVSENDNTNPNQLLNDSDKINAQLARTQEISMLVLEDPIIYPRKKTTRKKTKTKARKTKKTKRAK